MLSEKLDRRVINPRAIAAAVSVAAAHGIQIDQPHILADACSVRVHLSPAPVVARISTLTPLFRSPIETWLSRELAVTEFLSSRNAPVVAPSDLLPPGPHYHDGFFMSFWQYVQPISDAVPEPAIVGEMLAQLHTALRDYPGDLPYLAPPLNDIPRGLKQLEQYPKDILTPDDLALLQETYDRLLPQVSEPAEWVQPLHGDAHALNLIPTVDGWLWNDFEDTCKGPIGWDLVNLDEAGQAAYPNLPDPATLELYRQLRQLHGLVWAYVLLPEFPDWTEPTQSMLKNLRDIRP
ncbi:aminoglycoside phosphotransferase family protein [Egbenema bharatensis]|uniref:aminoglycoside phosphotransferase family protein n=1 Tax=Egbenema bharatensis TaxID=3463334 RepID=UPI003A8BE672